MKPITDLSWILFLDGERTALVSKKDETISVIGKTGSKLYATFDEFKKSLNGTLTIEKIEDPVQEKEAAILSGFPIKHAEFFNPELGEKPSYTRIPKSNSRYAAGYYGLKFQHGWTASFCPKVSTLSEYEHIGPFTTKLEMQHQISIKNKSLNV